MKGFLDSKQIVDLARRIGADAVHPGYGFLSENAEFAELCQASDITFIGPSTHAITLMGSKVKARELAESTSVPIVPGTDGAITTVKEALAFTKKAGYPVMIKASGGGRGLRVVRSDDELREDMEVAARLRAERGGHRVVDAAGIPGDRPAGQAATCRYLLGR